ncbi:MAG: radical SAM protein [Rhodocyclaceae bacterium]|nr:radical SAM protein [Rhodocyclaceae bacterium]
MPSNALAINDHSRDAAGLLYVYPVVSRRAGGVSVGINLNPNNACNWHCLYCQVPDLVRGTAPPIDLGRLETELRGFLGELLHGDFMRLRVPEGMRRIVDLAFSGNGEPTSAREFPEAVARVALVMREMNLDVPVRLITNGSLVDRPAVRRGLALLARCGGEVWFKVDAGSASRASAINGVRLDPKTVARRLGMCAGLCATWVQTCVFALDGQAPRDVEVDAYLAILAGAGIPALKGVLLYGLARPSMQAGAERLSVLSGADMERIASRIKEKGLAVRLSP